MTCWTCFNKKNSSQIVMKNNDLSKIYKNLEIKILIRDLGLSSSVERNKAIKSLVDIGEDAFEPVLNASRMNDSVIRRKTCDFFGLFGDSRGVEPLILLLEDKDRYVRRRAANALIKIGDERAVLPLKKALNDSEIKVRSRAAEALSNIGDIKSLDARRKANQNLTKIPVETAIGKIKKTERRKLHPVKLYPATTEAKNETREKINHNKNHHSSISSGINYKNNVIKGLIRDLGSSSSSERNRAVRSLVDIGEPAFEPVLNASRMNDSVIRRKTCDFFGLFGDSRGVEPLILLLEDKDGYVRRRAANALIKIGDERAVLPLIKALNDSEIKVRSRAAEALSNIGDERAVLPLKNYDIGSLIRDLGSSSSSERNRAVRSLVDIGEDAFEPVLNASRMNDSVIRRKTCDFFGLFGDSRGVEPLILLLEDKDGYVRRRAANALIKIGDERAVLPLIKALNDSEIKVRSRAAEALSNIGDERAVLPLKNYDIGSLIRDLGSSSSSERNRAVRSLVDIGEDAFEPVLNASRMNDSVIRRKTCDFFGLFGDSRGVEPLILLLEDKDGYVRRRAANALIKIGDERAVLPLKKALNDSEIKVRSRAAEALSNIGDIKSLDARRKANQNLTKIPVETAIGKIKKTERRKLHPVKSHPNKNEAKREIHHNEKVSYAAAEAVNKAEKQIPKIGTVTEKEDLKIDPPNHTITIQNRPAYHKISNKELNSPKYGSSEDKLKLENINGDLRVYHLGDYLPKNRYPDQDTFSKNILDFKNGNEKVALDFADKIKDLIKNKNLKFDVIIPIPSSKAHRIGNGSKLLTKKLANQLNCENGTNMLERVENLISAHLVEANERPTTDNHYNSIKCDKRVKGKRILLFDDIFTQGNTSQACSKKLFENGASNVILIVLGKTKY
ncbi:hypothetical protein JCM15415_18160 [Methanobacterium movens]